jgi:hypothetical protein
VNNEVLKLGSAILLFGLSVSAAFSGSLGPITQNTPPAICDKNRFVTEVECAGDFCGSIRIGCDVATLWDGTIGWTPFFSEETVSRSCPDRSAIVGFACKGNHCDDTALLCAKLQRGFVNNCQGSDFSSTPWFSEEAPFPISWPGFVAVKMDCRGSFCDERRFWLCRPR